MSETLRNLLHERAVSVSFKPPDLERITRAGGRRIRRRRAATALAAASAVALALAGGAAILGAAADPPPPPTVLPASPWPADAVSWAFGNTIYVSTGAGTEAIDVGHEVHAYVRTATGFVVLDETDAVYSVTELGVTGIGQMHDTLPDNRDQQRLVVNSSGTLVGWVDESASPGALTFRIYEAWRGTTRDFPGGPTSTDDSTFFALDDHTAYWRTKEGVHEVDVDTGEDRLIVARASLNPPDAVYSFEVYSAQNGVLAFSPNDDGTFYAGPSIEDAIELHNFRGAIPDDVEVKGRPSDGHVDPVRLSSTGAWLSFGLVEVGLVGEGEEAEVVFERISPLVFDTASGDRIPLALPETSFALPTVWLDDTTLQVVTATIPQDQPGTATSVTIYECSLPDGTCVVGARIAPPIPEFAAFPDGRYYGVA